MIIDDRIKEYFKGIDEYVERAYEIAEKARKKGVDPVDKVEIPIAHDLAARVEGLVSTLYPDIANSGLKEYIRELENEYGKNDERVALLAGLKTAQNKFAKYDDLEKRVDLGLRVAVAYLTLGVVTAPLEGISQVKIKKNPDGSEYVAVYYAGPIRSAGGTASATSVLAADFIRLHLGIGEYKPTDVEIKRYATEVEDYYSRVAAKQYHPTEEEIALIIKSVPVEITGDPTEKLEVSNYKDLDRVETNKIRGGMCLVLLDGLPLKAEKLLKRIRKYPKDFKLDHWHWLDDFIKLKTKLNAATKSSLKGEEVKYVPSKKYLSKIIAGRPVFAFPNTPGGFRLRYGRSRTGGLASTSLNNITIHLLEFTALGTQLAMEGPGKATVVTPCDSIEGPVVKLKDGSVKEITTKEELKKYRQKIDKILSLGDILIPYGEFVSNGQTLLPSSYVEEWWEQELELISREDYEKFKGKVPDLKEAVELSKKHDIPLHPYYNFFWHDLSVGELIELVKELRMNKKGEIIIREGREKVKESLEVLCVPHDYDKKIRMVKFYGKSLVLYEMFKSLMEKDDKDFDSIIESYKDRENVMEVLNEISDVKIKEKGIHRIGMKMGRPEKSERRLMKGKPQVLFPCGEEGGKMRNLMKSYEHEYIKADISVYLCQECGQESYTPKCMYCGGETKRMKYCQVCNIQTEAKEHCGRPTVYYKNAKIPVKKLIDERRSKYGISELPELIKGVKGVTGKDRNAEIIDKGLLRAKYDLYVNKDGTIRTDASDVPITHFRPREIGVSWKKLKEIGYDKDIYGNELKSDEQLLELLPQDIIISDNEYFSTSEYLIRVSKFVDEELKKLYGLKKGFYNFEKREDLIGHLVIGLAPHTSAGIIGRIIGFTKAKAYLAHPFWHAGKRRNCIVGDEDVLLINKNKEIVSFKMKELENINLGEYKALSLNDYGELEEREIKELVKLKAPETIYEIKAKNGRIIRVTGDHKMVVLDKNNKIVIKETRELGVGDKLMSLNNIKVEEKKRINIYEYYKNRKDIRIKGIKEDVRKFILDNGGYKEVVNKYDLGINYKRLWDMVEKDSITLEIFEKLKKDMSYNKSKAFLHYRKNGALIPFEIELNERIGFLAGLFLAEGYLRESKSKNKEKYVYQINWSISEEYIKDKVVEFCMSEFGKKPSVKKRGKVYGITLSGRIYYDLFKDIFGFNTCAYGKRANKTINYSKEFKKGLLSGMIVGNGNIDKSISITSVNRDLINDLVLISLSFGLYPSLEKEVRDTNLKKDNVFYKLRFYSSDIVFFKDVLLGSKKEKLKMIIENKNFGKKRTKKYGSFNVVEIKEINRIEEHGEEYVYDFVLDGNKRFVSGFGYLATYDCDGDEDSIMLLMDALLNFSQKYLPDTRGGRTMDAPLVLTTKLKPDEVDDESWNVDVVNRYPLKFYEETWNYPKPWELSREAKITIIEDLMKNGNPYHSLFTHDTYDINDGPIKTKYVELTSMPEKVRAQLELGEMIRAVDENVVAEKLLNMHFFKDIIGNLRKFTRQTFRCVDCNAKFRRIPLSGVKCPHCGGKIVFTVTEGSVRKYVEPIKQIMDKYRISTYTIQNFEILEKDLEALFGKKDRQMNLFSYK